MGVGGLLTPPCPRRRVHTASRNRVRVLLSGRTPLALSQGRWLSDKVRGVQGMDSPLPTPTRELGSQEQRRASVSVVTRSKICPSIQSHPPHPNIHAPGSLLYIY